MSILQPHYLQNQLVPQEQFRIDPLVDIAIHHNAPGKTPALKPSSNSNLAITSITGSATNLSQTPGAYLLIDFSGPNKPVLLVVGVVIEVIASEVVVGLEVVVSVLGEVIVVIVVGEGDVSEAIPKHKH